MADVRKLAALILVRMPFVGNETDFAAMVLASVKEVEREANERARQDEALREAQEKVRLAKLQRKARRQADKEWEERLLWELDKSLSPAPIREALTAVGY